MRILLIFDSYVKIKKFNFLSFNASDQVYLFSLTSKLSITATFVEKIKNAGCEVKIIQTARVINSAVDKLRDRYIRYIAELPERVKYKGRNLKEVFAIDECATLWWFSLISEKNPYKSDAFNRLVQLDSIVNIIKRERIEKILFGCVSRKLKNALSDYSVRNSIRFEVLPAGQIKGLKIRIRERQRMFYLKHILHLLNVVMKFFFMTWRIKRKIGSLSRVPSQDDSLLLVTYYPNIDMTLAQRGIFKNKLFAHLQETLENEGQNIIWIAMYTENNSISLAESLDYAERFINNGYTIFFLEEFNSISTQLKALLTMLISGLKFLKIEKAISQAHKFGEYNFYPIFKDDWYSSFAGAVGYCGLLHYNMFKSLLGKLKAKKCLYYCEMQAWEKALISAKDAIGSQMPLLSYQHATVSRMFLSYFNDPREIVDGRRYAITRPDKFICNGRITHDYMRESGWPEEKLLVAEAIRYNHLKEFLSIKWDKKRNIVFLAFPISAEESSSILTIVYESLKDLKDSEVWVKSHPLLNLEDVLGLSGISKKNFPFQFKKGPIEGLLSEARIVIAGESSVSIEALAFGCEVITVNLPEWINMSPQRYVETGIVRTVDSPEQLRQTVINIFKQDYRPQMHATEARRIINDFFCLNQDSDIPVRFLKLLR